jgi:hypothetical protein
VLSAPVSAGGARLFPIRLPEGYRLVMGVNGSPLMQMSVFAADGSLLEPSGPLRVVSLPPQARSPVQLLVTNEGVAPSLITLSLRADAPEPEPERELAPRVPEAATDPVDPARQPLRRSLDSEPATPDPSQSPHRRPRRRPSHRRRRQRPPSPRLQSRQDALILLVAGDGCAGFLGVLLAALLGTLVVQLAAFGQPQAELDPGALQVQIEGDQGETLLL